MSHKKRGRSSNSVSTEEDVPQISQSSPATTPAKKRRRRAEIFPWLDANLWKNWDGTGKSTFVHECKKFLSKDLEDIGTSNGPLPLRLEPEDYFCRAIIELLRAGAKSLLKKDQILKVLAEFVSFNPRAASLVSDSFSMVDQESVLYTEGKERDHFNSIVKSCSVLSTSLCELLDIDSLQSIGIISNWKNFSKKFIQIKTRLYYKQQKFNLFREETEGYGKIISELNSPVERTSHEQMTKSLQCHIGRFNLDPNRVVDLVLEAFEKQPVCDFFIPLLNSLKPSSETICEMIGFKLMTLEPPVQSLHTVIALLLLNKIITMEEIYPWLTPLDHIIEKQWERELKQAKEYASKSMIVSIKEKEGGEDADDLTLSDDRYFENQKFCLCEALLSIGAWEESNKIMKRMPRFSCVSHKRIAINLIKVIHYVIDPLYRKLNFVSSRLGAKRLPPLAKGVDPPQINSFDELSQNIEMILFLGPYIHHDPVLIYKLLRMMKVYLNHTNKTGNKKECSGLYYKILTVFDEVILPALNFLEANCGVAEEIWSCLRAYPYHMRFRVYGAWKGESIILLHPSLLKIRVDTFKKIKHLMRRLSKENVKQMGRQLGKLSHAHPTLIFDYILSQAQLYDNLISPIVDALKFLTSLSYDVLCYCLLEALSPFIKSGGGSTPTQSITVMLMPNRPRTKHDGSTIANWLQNLASFAAAVCKKYPIDLVPLLQYISNQLKNRQCLDLLLLKEIVQKMTGIEASDEMTSDQLQSMAGGELLRGEAGYFGQVRTAKRSAARLKEASNINNLAVSLCILMAQQRNCIIYQREGTREIHSKLVGKLFDQCQDTMVQFGTFMAISNTLDDYGKKIPSLDVLINEYFVSAEVAFFLWRPLFNAAISVKYDELRRGEKSLTSAQKKVKYTEAANAVHAPIVDLIRNSMLAFKSADGISAQFYVTFWSINLYDLYVPVEAYTREIVRIKQLAAAAGENKDLASSKRKKEQERCNALIDKLMDEQKRQKEHVERVVAKLSSEKDTWFASRSAKSAKNEAVTAFLQLCIFPRCIFTSPDAIYCAHFVNIIHSLSTPNFSTLICFDRIFCDIIYTVASCTENEANRYGLFLCTLLEGVMKWHGDKAVFDKECASYPGFVTKFRAANAFNNAESNDHVDYENFRHVCHKWHYKITKSMIVSLESKDFIQIRNSLIVLKRILPFYPKVANLASAVERWVERVRAEEKDHRQDLFALATSYIGQLKARWANIIPEENFHHKAPVTKKTGGGDKTTRANAAAPSSSSSAPAREEFPLSKDEGTLKKNTAATNGKGTSGSMVNGHALTPTPKIGEKILNESSGKGVLRSLMSTGVEASSNSAGNPVKKGKAPEGPEPSPNPERKEKDGSGARKSAKIVVNNKKSKDGDLDGSSKAAARKEKELPKDVVKDGGKAKLIQPTPTEVNSTSVNNKTKDRESLKDKGGAVSGAKVRVKEDGRSKTQSRSASEESGKSYPEVGGNSSMEKPPLMKKGSSSKDLREPRESGSGGTPSHRRSTEMDVSRDSKRRKLESSQPSSTTSSRSSGSKRNFRN